MDQQSIKKQLLENHWALMDVEFIQTTPNHRCIRKLYILTENGYTNMELEFYPCKRYKDIEWKYQKSFQYCKKHIHKLAYNPKKYSPECARVLPLLNEFLVYNGIELIIYKGGSIEADLANALDIPASNIENIVQKANSHDPRAEVNHYFSKIVEML